MSVENKSRRNFIVKIGQSGVFISFWSPMANAWVATRARKRSGAFMMPSDLQHIDLNLVMCNQSYSSSQISETPLASDLNQSLNPNVGTFVVGTGQISETPVGVAKIQVLDPFVATISFTTELAFLSSSITLTSSSLNMFMTSSSFSSSNINETPSTTTINLTLDQFVGSVSVSAALS